MKDSYIDKCPVCGANSFKHLNRYEKHYLVKCKNCGFVFSQKKPSVEELKNVYDNYGRNDYLSPVTIKRYNELLDYFEKFRARNRILDIGCGIGYFLEEAKKRGWEVFGIEYTDGAVDICRKKEIVTEKGTILDVDFPDEMFDVITSFEVIEHINNPLDELKEYYRILRRGGVFYLTTPNFNSIERILLKEKYNAIAYPEHLSYYTPKTIKFLFENNGFKKVRLETTGISISRLKVSSGVSNEKPISQSSSDEKLRQTIEANKWMKIIKLLLNKILTLCGIGNSLKAGFVKI